MQFQAFKKGERGEGALDDEGNTLLHLAVIENREGHFHDLLNCRSAVQKQNNWGITPLDLARFLGRTSLLSHLGPVKKDPINIFRNSDRKLHSITLEEIEKKLNFQYLEHLEFESPEMLRWIAKKSLKSLKKESSRQMNRWVLALHKKAILNPSRGHIYIRYIDPSLGYGIFAAKDIPALTYIGEYTGTVKRKKRKKYRFNDYIFGYMTGPKNSPFIIDAKEKGNFTRFINHSDEPNLTSRWVVEGGITRIIVFSNKFIPAGSQITYDYGKYYWRSRPNPKLL